MLQEARATVSYVENSFHLSKINFTSYFSFCSFHRSRRNRQHLALIFKPRNRRLRKSTLLLKDLKINIFCLNETIHNGNMTKTYVWLQRKSFTKINTIHLCLKETDYRFTLSVNTRHDIIPLHA